MFDFFYVNKIETNLAVQSNSLHVKQKIAPLGRMEPKPHSAPLLSALPSAIFSNRCFSANECLIQGPCVGVTGGNELSLTPPPYPKSFLIKIKAMESMLKVSIIANYLHKKEKLLSRNLSLISFCGAPSSPKLLLCGFRSGLKGDLKRKSKFLCPIPRWWMAIWMQIP